MNIVKKIAFVTVVALGTALPAVATEPDDVPIQEAVQNRVPKFVPTLRKLCSSLIVKNNNLLDEEKINSMPIDLVQKLIKQQLYNASLLQRQAIAQCDGHTKSVSSVCAVETADGWRIISGSTDTTIRIWDLEGNQLAQCHGHTDWVMSVCAVQAADGWRIISGSSDNTIRIWDLEGNQVGQCDGHTNSVMSVCAVQTADGWRIISGSRDTSIRIWNLEGNQVGRCNGHTDLVTSVYGAQTADGWRIISGSWDKTIRIWDLEGNELAMWDGHTKSVNSVYAVQTTDGLRIISGSGDRIYSGSSSDNTVRIWDLVGNQVGRCDGHRDVVTSVYAIQTADGWRIISGSWDKTIRIWDLEGNELAMCFGPTESVNSVYAVQTTDGLRIISGFLFDDTIIRIWDILDIYEQLDGINHEQAVAIYNCLKTEPYRDELYNQVRQIVKPQPVSRIEEDVVPQPDNHIEEIVEPQPDNRIEEGVKPQPDNHIEEIVEQEHAGSNRYFWPSFVGAFSLTSYLAYRYFKK